MCTKKIVLVSPVHIRDLRNVLDHKDLWTKNLPINSITVITKEKAESNIGINFINESDIYPDLTYNHVQELLESRTGRKDVNTGWYYQQFLKIAYAAKCSDDYYLLWDADLLPLNTIELFQGEKPYFTVKKEYHQPYFNTLDNLFHGEVQRSESGSFIAEHMLIYTAFMREMILRIESDSSLNGKYFYEKIISAINPQDICNNGFSEYETYGNYVMHYHPEKYTLRRLRTCRSGIALLGRHPSKEQIEWAAKSYDILALETKFGRNLFGVLICSTIGRKRFTFRDAVHFYKKILQPIDKCQRYVRNFILYFPKLIARKIGLYDYLRDVFWRI